MDSCRAELQISTAQKLLVYISCLYSPEILIMKSGDFLKSELFDFQMQEKTVFIEVPFESVDLIFHFLTSLKRNYAEKHSKVFIYSFYDDGVDVYLLIWEFSEDHDHVYDKNNSTS